MHLYHIGGLAGTDIGDQRTVGVEEAASLVGIKLEGLRLAELCGFMGSLRGLIGKSHNEDGSLLWHPEACILLLVS